MKKYFTLMMLAIFGFAVISCDRNDDPIVQDNDTYSTMRDVTGSFTNANSFAFTQGINIANTDVVLVYRKLSDAWQLIPKSVYLPNLTGYPTGRTFDYNYVFDSQNVQIRIDDPTFNLTTEITPAEVGQYLSNQKFRIVLIPASEGKNAAVDYNDYQSVIKYYKIKDRP